jgi:tryptophan synthase alpha chain
VGFGIKAADDVALIGRDSDGVVVGTALCNAVATSLKDGKATATTVSAVTDLVKSLASGARRARQRA